MKVTRLQLLLIFVALGVGGYYGYTWYEGQMTATMPTPPAPVSPTPPPPVDSLIGSTPAAPAKVVPKMHTPAVPTRISAPVASTSPGTSYTVMKGDTLWRIAEVQSPTHQGPGWVTIWQANKSTIKDFDHLEVGSNLTIPATLQEYVMPYWKPRALASAPHASSSYVVDLRQLPTGADSVLVDLKQLPTALDSVLVDLKQLPEASDTMLASLPRDQRVDLNELPAAPEMAVASVIVAPDDFTTSAFRWPVEDHFGQPQYR